MEKIKIHLYFAEFSQTFFKIMERISKVACNLLICLKQHTIDTKKFYIDLLWDKILY